MDLGDRWRHYGILDASVEVVEEESALTAIFQKKGFADLCQQSAILEQSRRPGKRQR